MKVLVLSLNKEVIEVFSSVEKVVTFLKKEWNLGGLSFEGEEVTVERGVDFLLNEVGCVECDSKDLIEMGDDYCEIELSEFEII